MLASVLDRWTTSAPLLMAGAAVLLYASSRVAVEAVTRVDDPSPEKSALGHWMPIAWVAIISALLGNFEVALGVVFATCVAMLSLVLGLLTFMSNADAEPVRGVRAWPFVMPLALLLLVAGFTASLSLIHAAMLAIIGAFVVGLWDMSDVQAPSVVTHEKVRRPQLFLALLAAGVGGWLALRATVMSASQVRILSSGLIAATVLSPLLSLPILGTAAVAAQRGRMGSVTSTLVMIVLLNLALLLPVVIVIGYARNLIISLMNGTRDLELLRAQLRPIPFPLAAWRIDVVLILILGAMLVPISLGRWSLKRHEGLILVILYAVYLLMSTALAVRL